MPPALCTVGPRLRDHKKASKMISQRGWPDDREFINVSHLWLQDDNGQLEPIKCEIFMNPLTSGTPFERPFLCGLSNEVIFCVYGEGLQHWIYFILYFSIRLGSN